MKINKDLWTAKSLDTPILASRTIKPIPEKNILKKSGTPPAKNFAENSQSS